MIRYLSILAFSSEKRFLVPISTKRFIFLAKQVGSIEADLKQKSSAYNALKVSLQSMEKKQTGSLLTRNLGDLVKKVRY